LIAGRDGTTLQSMATDPHGIEILEVDTSWGPMCAEDIGSHRVCPGDDHPSVRTRPDRPRVPKK
jgi:hypothetical protein